MCLEIFIPNGITTVKIFDAEDQFGKTFAPRIFFSRSRALISEQDYDQMLFDYDDGISAHRLPRFFTTGFSYPFCPAAAAKSHNSVFGIIIVADHAIFVDIYHAQSRANRRANIIYTINSSFTLALSAELFFPPKSVYFPLLLSNLGTGLFEKKGWISLS